ncbi:hypothetical protein OkiPb01103_41550 [Escherichia coli]
MEIERALLVGYQLVPEHAGNALTDAELRRKAADELTCMTARINRGETIPEPVKQLPVMGGRPLNRAQALAKIAEIKAKFGLKGASV